MAVEDFNMVLDGRVEKCPPGMQIGKEVETFSQIVG